MRAARLAAIGRMVCEETKVDPPQEGQLLVRMRMAAICGSDLHIVYDGVDLPPFPQLPGFPGHEGVGEVMESRAAGFRGGELVLTCPFVPFARCFAEYLTLPAASCLKLPAYEGPLEHLLMAQQFGTTLFALRRARYDFVGRTVMVMGQGSAGVFFAWLAKRLGARKVIVSDLSEARLAHARRMGADVALRAEPSGEHVRAAVLEHTGGEGADFLIEAVGRRASLLQAIDLVRPGGELLCFGLPDSHDPVLFNFHDFFRKRLSAYAHHGTQFEPGLVSFQTALELIATRQIDVSQFVSHRLPLARIDEAMRLAQERADGARKIAIVF
jgi:L-iditol 2-dehydrogenase